MTATVDLPPVAKLERSILACGEDVHKGGTNDGSGFTAWDVRHSNTATSDRAEGIVALLGYYTTPNYSVPERKRRGEKEIRRFLDRYLNLPERLILWRTVSDEWPVAGLTANRLDTLYKTSGAVLAEPVRVLPDTTVGGYLHAQRIAHAEVIELYRRHEQADATFDEHLLKLPTYITRLDRFQEALRLHYQAWIDERLAIAAKIAEIVERDANED